MSLPITDPYVVYHGALGSFGTAYLPEGADAQSVARHLEAMDGIEVAYTNADSCARYELPNDRIGDIIVVSIANKVLGTSPDRHDFSQFKEPLRSHGNANMLIEKIQNKGWKHIKNSKWVCPTPQHNKYAPR